MNTAYLLPVVCAGLLFGQLGRAQVPAPEAAPVADYIRYRSGTQPGEGDVLETANSRFVKGNHTLDLISVVHLGDADYFKRLKLALTGYHVVFYEMVGGPFTEEKANISKQAASPDEAMAQIQALQQMAKKLLGLEFQLDSLNYLAPNFIHADLSEGDLSEISGDKELFSNLMAKALAVAQSGKIQGLPTSEAEINQLLSNLLASVLAGDSNAIKRSLGPMLAEAEPFITQLEDGEGTILISQRNEIVIEKVKESIAARGEAPQTDAILFGAGHMSDLEEKLLNLGYEKKETTWEPAWVIGEGQNPNDKPLRIDEILEQVGALMEMIRE